jgi:hypothetical protein
LGRDIQPVKRDHALGFATTGVVVVVVVGVEYAEPYGDGVNPEGDVVDAGRAGGVLADTPRSFAMARITLRTDDQPKITTKMVAVIHGNSNTNV